LKSSKVMKLFGVFITLLISLSASYAADTSDLNSTDISNQVMTDPGLSDDSGLSDTNTDDDGNDSLTDYNSNDTFNDGIEPTIYYAMADGATSISLDDSGNDSNSQGEDNLSTDSSNGTGNNSLSFGWGVSGSSNWSSGNMPTTTVTTMEDPQKNKIPMKKTGIPFLPAELGIISIIGGFMINRIRS